MFFFVFFVGFQMSRVSLVVFLNGEDGMLVVGMKRLGRDHCKVCTDDITVGHRWP